MGMEIEFEQKCGKCYGTCAWMDRRQCDRCGGTGYVTTSLGEQLLEFLEHQGIGPMKEKGKDDER